MASPDKESRYIILKKVRDMLTVSSIDYMSPESAAAEATEQAKDHPGEVYTVCKALSDFKAGEIPVEQTNYRQAASRRAE